MFCRHPVFTLIHTSPGPHTECYYQCGCTCSRITVTISSPWAAHVLRGGKTHFSCLLWLYCALFSFITPPAFPLIQSSINGKALLHQQRVWTVFALLVRVWREGPIISAVWKFKRHACSNLLFHSPGPLSSQSSFPVGYSSYPCTGKPSPAAASDPELSS